MHTHTHTHTHLGTTLWAMLYKVTNHLTHSVFLRIYSFPHQPTPLLSFHFSTTHSHSHIHLPPSPPPSPGPDNYKYKIVPRVAGRAETFVVVALRVANLSRAVGYWRDILGMREVTGASSSSLLQVIRLSTTQCIPLSTYMTCS